MKRRILLAIAVLGVGIGVAVALFVTRDHGDDAVASTSRTSSTTLATRSDRTRARPTGGPCPRGRRGRARRVPRYPWSGRRRHGCSPPPPAYAYTVRTDTSGVLAAEMPTPWADVQTTEIAGRRRLTPQIVAAPDVAAYLQGYGAPGEASPSARAGHDRWCLAQEQRPLGRLRLRRPAVRRRRVPRFDPGVAGAAPPPASSASAVSPTGTRVTAHRGAGGDHR
jgi:hypothetical protein